MMGERGRRERRESEWCRGEARMEWKGQRGEQSGAEGRPE